MAEVIKVNKNHFDRNLVKILPCYVAEDTYTPQKYAMYFLNLHPNHGFILEKGYMGYHTVEEGSVSPIGWMMVDDYDY